MKSDEKMAKTLMIIFKTIMSALRYNAKLSQKKVGEYEIDRYYNMIEKLPKKQIKEIWEE